MPGRRRCALALPIVLWLAACTAAQPAPSAMPSARSELRVAVAALPSSIDPWSAADAASFLVTRQVFETLVGYEAGSLRLVPRLARSWELSPDGTVWTFALREGVRFHDGGTFDADAVVFDFERARVSSNAARPGRPDGFRSWVSQWGGFDGASLITKVEARSPQSVAFTTRAPYGPFLAALALPAFAIVSPRSIGDDRDGFMTAATNGAAGTGPFRVVPGAWRADALTLERNDGYWGEPAGVGRLVFREIRDASARLAELKSGGVDMVRDLAPTGAVAIKSDPNMQTIAQPTLGVGYLGFDPAATPFDDRAVRRAVASAVNRPAIASVLFGGYDGRVASQLLPPGMLGYDDTVMEFVRHDESSARRALADAGLAAGVTTDLWYPSAARPWAPEPRRLAEAVAADLVRVGINATPRSADAATYERDAAAGRFPLWLGGAGGRPTDIVDPDVYFAGASRGGTLSELLRAARAQVDLSKRAELYKQASKLIQADVPRLPLFQVGGLIAASRKVAGYVPHPAAVDTFAGVRVQR